MNARLFFRTMYVPVFQLSYFVLTINVLTSYFLPRYYGLTYVLLPRFE